MRFAIQLMIDGGDAADKTQEIISFDRTDGALSIDDLGLTLEEAKKGPCCAPDRDYLCSGDGSFPVPAALDMSVS
ncbi:hypothetical protein [Mesorhizobium sp. 1B3]|uniref:hypothetical protein n=1 Tax=Mesorhizobium sp. 1B3 TaxID=3243599 RepID=UPI003D95F1AD